MRRTGVCRRVSRSRDGRAAWGKEVGLHPWAGWLLQGRSGESKENGSEMSAEGDWGAGLHQPLPPGGGGRTGGSRGRHSSWRGTLGTPEEAAHCSGTWASDARTPQTLPKHLLCARRWGRSGEQGSPVLAPLSIVMEATTMQKQASKKKKKGILDRDKGLGRQ